MTENKFVEIDNTEQYYLIGRYVADFELIVYQIRNSLNILFQMSGLKNWKMSEIVFGSKQFTAEPLISCFENISNELLKDIDEDNINANSDIKPKELLKLISDFRKKFSEQIAVRNDIVHGTYIIPNLVQVEDIDKIDMEGLYIFKKTPDKKGARHKVVSEKRQDIINHIETLYSLYSEFNKIKIKLFVMVGKE